MNNTANHSFSLLNHHKMSRSAEQVWFCPRQGSGIMSNGGFGFSPFTQGPTSHQKWETHTSTDVYEKWKRGVVLMCMCVCVAVAVASPSWLEFGETPSKPAGRTLDNKTLVNTHPCTPPASLHLNWTPELNLQTQSELSKIPLASQKCPHFAVKTYVCWSSLCIMYRHRLILYQTFVVMLIHF